MNQVETQILGGTPQASRNPRSKQILSYYFSTFSIELSNLHNFLNPLNRHRDHVTQGAVPPDMDHVTVLESLPPNALECCGLTSAIIMFIELSCTIFGIVKSYQR